MAHVHQYSPRKWTWAVLTADDCPRVLLIFSIGLVPFYVFLWTFFLCLTNQFCLESALRFNGKQSAFAGKQQL